MRNLKSIKHLLKNYQVEFNSTNTTKEEFLTLAEQSTPVYEPEYLNEKIKQILLQYNYAMPVDYKRLTPTDKDVVETSEIYQTSVERYHALYQWTCIVKHHCNGSLSLGFIRQNRLSGQGRFVRGFISTAKKIIKTLEKEYKVSATFQLSL